MEEFSRRAEREDTGLFARLRAGEVVTVDLGDMREAALLWPEFQEFYRRLGHRVVLHLPLHAGEQIEWRYLGFLGLGLTDAGTPSADLLTLVETLSAQASLAISMDGLATAARAVAITRERKTAAQERAAQLARANEALTRSTARLAAEPELGAFLGAVLVEAAQQAGTGGNALFLYDPGPHVLTMRMYALGDDLLDVASDPRLAIWRTPVPVDINTAWENLQHRKPLLHVVDTPDPDLWPHSVPWHREMGHASVVSIALFVGERAIGFMGLYFRDRRGVLPERAELAQALANQAALALELTRLGEEARREARQAATEAERNRLAGEIHDTLAQVHARAMPENG